MAETNGTGGPRFYAERTVAAPERPPLVQDADVDVCVIGGGLAGLTVAREVVRRGWSVAVLEAKKVAWNASGRNAGFVAPGFAEQIENIIERVGLARAKQLWALSNSGAEYVRAAIRETDMPGVTPVDGRLIAMRKDAEDELLRHVAMMRVDFGAELDLWPTEQVREVLRSERYFQAVHWPGAFQVHPRNYALGLAAAAEQAGARIFEQTPALHIDSAGVRKLIDTPKGRLRAGHVVLAGGAQLGSVFRAVSDTILPASSFMAVTASLGEALAEAVRYPGCVSDSRRGGDYYRIVDGGRLLWGCGISTRLSAPRGLAASIEREIRSVYPQLGAVKVDHAWSGVMGYTVHKMPLIGEVMPGVWVAAAFGGHGINTSAMAGDLIASAIVEGDDRWRLFSSYELVWAGGAWGRAAAQILFWARGLEETIAESLAQRREAARRHAAEQAAREAVERERRVADAIERRAAEEAARAAAEESAERFAAAQRTAAQRARQTAVESRQPRVSDAAAAHNVELLRTARAAAEADLGVETSPDVDQAPAADEKAAARRHVTARRKAKHT
jgi:glycine/D-amino acid oxidase-like deaminating enzyme